MKAWLTLLPGLAAVACGNAGPPRDAAVRSDSSGVEIVTSPPADQALAWEFQAVLTLGGANDGPNAFFNVPPAGVAFGPAGQVVVLDAGNKRIHVFSESGETLRSMARGGGGPGELQFPSSLFVDSTGDVFVHDFGHRALLRFDSSGTYLDQTAAPSGIFGPIRSDARARVFATRQRDASTDAYTLHLFRSTGSDTLELVEAPIPGMRSVFYASCGVGISLAPLFSDPPSWDARGGRVVTTAPPDYVVRVFEDGSEVRNVRRSVRPQTATRESVLREFGEGEPWTIGSRHCVVPAEEMIEQRGFAQLIPTVSRVAVAPDGYLWVQREVIGEQTGPIDIFDDTGEYVGTLPATTPWPLTFGSRDRMLVLETDELDVQKVVVYSIVRK